MTRITSRFIEVEMFYTSDGEAFADDSAASDHQDIIDQKESLLGCMPNVDEDALKKLIKKHADYIQMVIDSVNGENK